MSEETAGKGALEHHVRRLLAAIVVFAALIGGSVVSPSAWAAGSNGEAGKSSNAILADAEKVTKVASSARITGTVKSGKTVYSFNLQVAGGKGGGTFTIGKAKLDLVSYPPKLYLKGGKAAWQDLGAGSAGSLLAGHWIVTTTSNADFKSFTMFFNITKLLGTLPKKGDLTKKAVTSFHGVQAIPLSAGGGTLYVAATGKPYILGIVVSSGSAAGTSLQFSDFNTANVPPKPKNALNIGKATGS